MAGKRICFALLLVVLVACGGQETADVAPEDANTEYRLEVELVGLIAFFQDGDKLWALLPDANYDPANAQKTDLPPGLYDQISHMTPAEKEIFLRENFPPHLATITIENAEAVTTGLSVPPPKDPIEGSVLGLSFTPTTPGMSTQFTKLATAQTIITSLSLTGADATEVDKLDQLDGAIRTELAGNRLDKRLAAAIRLQDMSVEARPFPNSSGQVPKFTFMPPTFNPDDCLETTQRFELGELMIAKSSFLGNLKISRAGMDPLEVRPKDPALPIKIIFSNEAPTHTTLPHHDGFRWFYSLLDLNALPLLKYHYTPCEPPEHLVGSKCPEYGMTQ